MSLVPYLLSLIVDKLLPISWGAPGNSVFLYYTSNSVLVFLPTSVVLHTGYPLKLPGELKTKTKTNNCLDASSEQLNQKFKKGYQL